MCHWHTWQLAWLDSVWYSSPSATSQVLSGQTLEHLVLVDVAVNLSLPRPVNKVPKINFGTPRNSKYSTELRARQLSIHTGSGLTIAAAAIAQERTAQISSYL